MNVILKAHIQPQELTEAEMKEFTEWQARMAARTPEQVASDAVLAAQKISQARKEYLFRDAFMGFIICRMQMVYLESVGTMGVTVRECNVVCYYAGAWVLRLTIEELMGVLEHEALHILDHHMARMASRQPKAWNMACDMAINCLIKLPLPRPGCFAPDEWKNKAAEYIYDQLPREGDGGEGEGPEGEGEGEGEGKEGEGKEGKGEKNGKGKSKQSCKEYGKFGKPFDNHDVWKEADHPGLVQVVVKQMVQEALARNKGQYPGQYQTLIEKILKSKCDWRAMLRYYVTAKIRSFRKLSYKHRDRRRLTVSNFVFPGHVRKEGLELIVVCDTSGSMMSKKDMEQFFTELEGIIKQTSAVTRLIQIDADVQDDRMYKKGDWKKINIKGGGGTDFRPVFKYIEDKKYKPCVVVFYTDGCGDFPDKASVPRYQVLWAMVTDCVAPFGKTIKLDLD
jgi:predicted metal-dependent peptidase